MEIKDCPRVNGKGIFAANIYSIGDIVHTLNGEIKHIPSKYSIEISKDNHIIDNIAKYINHSFSPNVKISKLNIVAIKDINIDDEICYNYNHSESVMAAPFYSEGQLVSGKNDKAIKQRFTIKSDSKDLTINNIEAIINFMT